MCFFSIGQRKSYDVYQTSHFFFGFIREPLLHFHASWKSSEFDNAPMTLNLAGEWGSSKICSLLAEIKSGYKNIAYCDLKIFCFWQYYLDNDPCFIIILPSGVATEHQTCENERKNNWLCVKCWRPGSGNVVWSFLFSVFRSWSHCLYAKYAAFNPPLSAIFSPSVWFPLTLSVLSKFKFKFCRQGHWNFFKCILITSYGVF